MAARTRLHCSALFEVFAKVDRVSSVDQVDPFISTIYPHNCDDKELLSCLPKFTFPVSKLFASSAVDHFTFVLTDIESIFRFGFCRLSPDAETCLCVVSYHPWFEVFFRLLNYVAELLKCDANVEQFLELLLKCDVSQAQTFVSVGVEPMQQKFTFTSPNKELLPSIPEDRNLMEYYSAVDVKNMITIFASLLFERRIIVTSRRLSRLTSCVHAAQALLYPLHWQQIYIPALPPHLLDYCSAPMPYLIGVHSSLLTECLKAELDDAVILDADNNTVACHYDDVSVLPVKVVKRLTKKLKLNCSSSVKPAPLLGDTVSRAFLGALVDIIGNYHAAVHYNTAMKHYVFSETDYVASRSSKLRPVLNILLKSQSFRQFIDERLGLLNKNVTYTDVFEADLKQFARRKKHSKALSESVKKTFKEMLKLSELTKTPEEYLPIKRNRSGTVPSIDSALHQMAAASVSPHVSRVLRSPVSPTSPKICRALYHSFDVSWSDDTAPSSVVRHDSSHDLVSVVLRQSSRQKSSRDVTSIYRQSVDDTDIAVPRTSLLTDPDLQLVLRKSFSFDDLFSTTPSNCNQLQLPAQSDDRSSVSTMSDDLSDSRSLSESTELINNSNSCEAVKQISDTDTGSSEADNTKLCDIEASQQTNNSDDSHNKPLSRVKLLVKTLERAAHVEPHESSELSRVGESNSRVLCGTRSLPRGLTLQSVKCERPSPLEPVMHDVLSVAARRRALLSAVEPKPVQGSRTVMRSDHFESVATRTENLLKYVGQRSTTVYRDPLVRHVGVYFPVSRDPSLRHGTGVSTEARNASFRHGTVMSTMTSAGDPSLVPLTLNQLVINTSCHTYRQTDRSGVSCTLPQQTVLPPTATTDTHATTDSDCDTTATDTTTNTDTATTDTDTAVGAIASTADSDTTTTGADTATGAATGAATATAGECNITDLRTDIILSFIMSPTIAEYSDC